MSSPGPPATVESILAFAEEFRGQFDAMLDADRKARKKHKALMTKLQELETLCEEPLASFSVDKMEKLQTLYLEILALCPNSTLAAEWSAAEWPSMFAELSTMAAKVQQMQTLCEEALASFSTDKMKKIASLLTEIEAFGTTPRAPRNFDRITEPPTALLLELHARCTKALAKMSHVAAPPRSTTDVPPSRSA